jgi:C-terminal peptidase prc
MTKAKWTGLLAAVALALAAGLPARAADDKDAKTEPKPSHPYVVLIGINDYQDSHITPRPHAEADAKALYDVFTDPKYLGADASHVKLLLGKEDRERHSEPATKENILKALEGLKDARPDDLVILAWIGEGGSLGQQGDRRCYFATDSTLKGREKDAVAAATVGEVLDKLRSQHFCAFVDVNFKGFTSKESIPEPDLRTNFFREFLGDDGTEDHAAVPGRAVFLATSGLTAPLDLSKHDAFVQVIFDGLKGKADKEGYEPDGVVTVDELMEYLDKELPEQYRTHGKTDKEKESTHLVMGGRGSHFVLTHNPAVADKVAERLKKLDEMAREKKLNADLAAEGRQLLERMPKLEAQRSLRKDYQALVDGQIDLDKFNSRRDKILAERKLKHSAAESFARTVIEVSDRVKSKYVKEVNQGNLVAWAVRGLYRRVDEKIPADIQERLTKAPKMDENELTELLVDVRESLGKREDLDNHKDVDIALQRMMSHLDPYTTYIDPETVTRVEGDISGNFTGIGIQIRKDAARDMLQVVTPIKGSPAYRKGIQAGDIITTITREVDSEGKPLPKPEVISTKGLPLSDAVKKILGEPDTKVKLTVEREGAKEPLQFELTRSHIEVESVLGVKRDAKSADWDFYIDPANKIAYIRLTSFARNTFRDLKEAMKKLSKAGINGLVLDLRFNPGGYLDSAVDISNLFISDGLIVKIRPRVGAEIPYYGHPATKYPGFPMACLVNGGSASGSEILAACLQDQERAKIIGERSYGKGSVQDITQFEGGELKMTIATFWRPNGKNLNKSSTKGNEDEDWGVRPDKGYLVKLSPKEREELGEHQRNAEIIAPRGEAPATEKTEFKDVQLEKALEYLRGQIKTAAQAAQKKAG